MTELELDILHYASQGESYKMIQYYTGNPSKRFISITIRKWEPELWDIISNPGKRKELIKNNYQLKTIE